MPAGPTKLSPIMPERPRPRMVSDRPVATWLVATLSVRNPNSSENTAPARMPASTPSQGEPVSRRGGEAADRAHDHHALDAEIEHAGALDDEFAERGDQQRRRRGRDGQKNAFGNFHDQAP